jgi:2-keto-3-deoxy-L-rhamnonate aldolase RhmA
MKKLGMTLVLVMSLLMGSSSLLGSKGGATAPGVSLKTRLQRGDLCMGTFLAMLGGGDVVQFLAGQGMDFIILDMEHGAFDTSLARQTIVAAQGTGMAALTRVPEPDHLVSLMLDAGAEGIVIPRVETREQAEALVRNGRYLPEGNRGISTLAGHNQFTKLANVGQFLKDRNQNVLLFVMIETPKGIANRDAILSTRGIDGVIVGTGDLSMNMGFPGQPDHPVVIAEAEKILQTAKEKHLIGSIPIRKTSMTEKWVKSGMKMITLSSDVGLFGAGVELYMNSVKAVSINR